MYWCGVSHGNSLFSSYVAVYHSIFTDAGGVIGGGLVGIARLERLKFAIARVLYRIVYYYYLLLLGLLGTTC